jgi:outer membrane biosynthesis protein TonB
MINTLKISAAQVALCHEIMKYFGAFKAGSKTKQDNEVTEEMTERFKKGLFRRIELREAHEVLRKKVACPYFITKNHAAKASQKDGAGLYNVQKLIDFAAKHPPKAEEETKPKAKKTAKKEAAPKKEAKGAAKGKSKSKKETPAESEKPAESEAAPAAATTESTESAS